MQCGKSLPVPIRVPFFSGTNAGIIVMDFQQWIVDVSGVELKPWQDARDPARGRGSCSSCGPRGLLRALLIAALTIACTVLKILRDVKKQSFVAARCEMSTINLKV